MPLKHYDFEVGPQGAAANAGNTGATVMALNTGTAIFDAASAMTGNFGLKLTSSANVNGITARFNALAAHKTMAVSITFIAPNVTGSDRNIFNINASPDVPTIRVSINAAQNIVWDGKTLVTDFKDTGVTTIPGRKYRMEFLLVVGATDATGNLRCNIYEGNGGVPLNADLTNTAFHMGIIAISGIDVNLAPSLVFSVDDIRFDDGSTAWLGPVPDGATPTNIARPKSLLSNPGSFTNVGGAAGIPEALADESDTTYVSSPGAPAGSAMSIVVSPLTLGPVTVKVRHRASATEPAISRKYDLMQDSTVIATRTVTLTTAWVDYTFSTTTPETALISAPRNNLALRITDTSA